MPQHVLVVDDDRAIRRVVEMALEDEGYTVTTAANGREALEAIATQAPALVLLDLNMPVMSGWDVTAQVQQQGLEVPLVYMTAGNSARAEAERHRVAGYLAKPFALHELIEVVERCRVPHGGDEVVT